MKVEDLIVYGKKYIHSDFVTLLLSNLLDMNCLELLNHLEDKVDNSICEVYYNQVEQVREKKPIQYVIGNVNFYGYNFIVNENVLIPRFETEELVEKTIGFIDSVFGRKVDIVDLGTGSGCIAITLKKEIDCNVDAVDISTKALDVAKKNADLNGVSINFYQNDMLDGFDKKYDVIVSNPPYLSYDETVMDIVKDNEPNIALYADNDGLYFYEKILSSCRKNLNDKFLIAFEIGYLQASAIVELANKYFENIVCKIDKDLQGKDRFVFIYSK